MLLTTGKCVGGEEPFYALDSLHEGFRTQDLKQIAKVLLYLQENDIHDYGQLD